MNYTNLKTLKKEQNAKLTNRHNKDIWDIINTLEVMKPMYKDVIYKEGFNDCLDLLKRAVKIMEKPNYAIMIKNMAIEIETLKNSKK